MFLSCHSDTLIIKYSNFNSYDFIVLSFFYLYLVYCNPNCVTDRSRFLGGGVWTERLIFAVADKNKLLREVTLKKVTYSADHFDVKYETC